MSRNLELPGLLLAGSVLICAIGGCAPRTPPSAAQPTPSQAAIPATAEHKTPGASGAGTPTALPTYTESVSTVGRDVRVSALGNVYIRRGPDTAFNPISVLPKGSSAIAEGRDVLSNWLRITLPGAAGDVGWISIMTQFTSVSGNVDALQEFDPQEWPELASLRNCTHHEMMVMPLGATLPPVSEFPNNVIQVDPGTYSVVDVDVDGYPGVLQVDIREGMAVDVLVDGAGEKKKCPPP